MLTRRSNHLEYKLSAEQIVVAVKKAEKESENFIQNYQERTGWRSYVPSYFKSSYWYGSEDLEKVEPGSGIQTPTESNASTGNFGGSEEDT